MFQFCTTRSMLWWDRADGPRGTRSDRFRCAFPIRSSPTTRVGTSRAATSGRIQLVIGRTCIPAGECSSLLFLFTEIDEDDAPTRIRVGSHWDVPAVLLPYGDRGAPGHMLGPQVDAASAHRRVALATGSPGDVYVCHPFLVHAAQANHGRRPRFLGQPGLPPPLAYGCRPFDITVVDGEPSPVGRTIRDALAAAR